MGKKMPILLMVILLLSLLSMGNSQPVKALDYGASISPQSQIIPSPGFIKSHSQDILDNAVKFNWFAARLLPVHPVIPGKMISGLLQDRLQQPGWIRTAQGRWQTGTVNRGSSETRLNALKNCQIVKNINHFPISVSSSFSRDLLECSPQGLFLRI
jgi:hypothetical protein